MRQSAAVVIVGGGVIGASVAYHLAMRGITEALVIERSGLGSGSTGRSAGGIRQQFSTEVNCRLSMLSVEKLLRFEADTGWDPSFHQVGYLFLLTRPDDWSSFQASAAMQQSLGLPVSLLSAADVQARVPPLVVDDVLGATFCPTDGHADPTQVCLGYAAAARARGVEVASGVSVTGIATQSGRVEAVETDDGRISTPLVVDAAGPWAAQIAAMAGADVPIQPYRRQLYFIERFPEVPHDAPMVVDFATSMYFRREGPGLLLGMTDRAEPSSFNMNTDDAFLGMLIENTIRRLPAIENASLASGWAGLYDVTPDANPVLGPMPQVEGLLMAAGFSGHGFMHAPAVGQLVAEIIADGEATTIDISPFRIERFAAGPLAAERNVI
jgi:sarcosine oxidase, subunit beta